MFKRFALPFLLATVLLGPVIGVVGASPVPPADKVSPWVLEATANGTQTDFLVVLDEQADLSAAYDLPTKQERGRFVRDTLWETAQRSQANLRAWLDARNVPYQSFYIVNLLYVQTGDRALVDALSARSDVARIEANPRIQNIETGFLGKQSDKNPVSPTLSPQAVEWNISQVNADDVWALGYTGEGIVVGGQDTGYDWDHPALINQYRGWDGSTANHDYNWHDAIAGSSQPLDPYGHGTHTMGTAIGSDGGSNQIGIAPGAKWIGCRNMNSSGYGTPTSYLECFQFFLAPYPVDGEPEDGDPDKAPDVTNNSWSCPTTEGCSWNTLQTAVEAQRAAGIMTVVSAGNEGSGCSSVAQPPGLYDASYSVGATDSSDVIAGFSSRGPVTIDGSNRLKPDISAPGVDIRSSIPGGSYQGGPRWQGTSMAAPHVTGAVALLWSAQPALRNQIDLTEDILNQTSVPRYSTQCGDPANTVPNNVYGWGRLDALAAVQLASTVSGVGRLAGTVSDDVGMPIVGAEVQVSNAPLLIKKTTTFTAGLYGLTIFSDTHAVTVTVPGYIPYLTTGVTVTAGSTTTLAVTLMVTPTYVISGHVRDAITSLPLSATVSLPGSPVTRTQTDPATGFYSLTVVSGSYDLQAEAARHFSQTRSITVTGDRIEDFDLEPVCTPVFGVDFDHAPPEIVAWEPVTFTAAVATGTAELPITYTWDFGDDSGVREGNPIVHIFPFSPTTQTYTVTLTVANACPSHWTTWQTVTVRAGTLPCPLLSDVDFDYTPLEPMAWETVAFTATAAIGTAVRPITYTWGFGDGITSTLHTNTVTHAFPFATTDLTYTVSLTITNACPSQQSVWETITVLSFPHAVYMPLVLRND